MITEPGLDDKDAARDQQHQFLLASTATAPSAPPSESAPTSPIIIEAG